MRTHLLAVVILFFLLLISEAQGIRLMSDGHQKLQEEKLAPRSKTVKDGSVTTTSLCKDGQCSGEGRKLMVMMSHNSSPPSTTPTKFEGNGENKADGTSKRDANYAHSGEDAKFSDNSSPVSSLWEGSAPAQQYPDVMDYTPAKRKSPIHN